LSPAAGQPSQPHVATLRAPPRGIGALDMASQAELELAAEDAERALASLRERAYVPAAFYLDTALTSNGIFDPPPAWLAQITTRVRAAGALIVADEVQYGLGRSGSHFWGFERRGLKPDIVTLGKPVGNGFPLGVVISSRVVVEEFQARYGFFSTFGGNAVAAAAALAVLQVLDREQLQQNAQETGAYLRAGLASLAARHAILGEVRGAGLLLGLELIDPRAGGPATPKAKRIVNMLCARHGILTGLEGPQGNVLKLRPPLSFRRVHADLLIGAIDATLSALRDV